MPGPFYVLRCWEELDRVPRLSLRVRGRSALDRHLARLETGKQDPTLSRLEKLAKALGVKVGRLLE